MLPTCGEMLWIEVFNTSSLTFCYIALLESIVVLFFYHYDENTLLPAWMLMLSKHRKRLRSTGVRL